MNAKRMLALAGAMTIVLLLSGFGTQAWGQEEYWYKGTDGVWAKSDNWTTNLSDLSENLGTYPGANDWAYFKPLYDNNVLINDDCIISTSASPVTVKRVYLQTGDNGITQVPMDLRIFTAGTLTISELLSVASGNTINLESNPGASPSLQLNGTVFLEGGYASYPTEIYGSLTTKRINLGTNSFVEMGDLRYTYFGENLDVWFNRDTGMLLSDVHFKDDITIACEFNPGAYNIWLGKDAGIVRSATNNQNQKFITFDNQHVGSYGMIIKDVKYWQTSAGAFEPSRTTDKYFEFSVGSSKVAAILVDVRYAHYLLTTVWDIGPDQPFRGVGIRTVQLHHPRNNATNKYQYYWIVQGVGLYQDYNRYFYNEDGIQEIYWSQALALNAQLNQICFKVEFHPGYIQGSPQNVYAARYSNNYEDLWTGTIFAQAQWYIDGSFPIDPSNVSGRVLVTMCPTSGFGDITIASSTDPVPVELVSFSARYMDGAVRLNWQTATELNNYGFAIERSADGERWEDVGFVAGHGTSFSPKNYEHVDQLGDELLRLPQLAYRLRQMDRDGTTEYSNIVFVRTGELPEGIELYAAYPNPFNPATTISFAIGAPAHVTLKVYNTLGQVVTTLLAGSAMDAGLHTVPFNGDQLPSGVYMAVLEADGAVQHQKLVLNK